MTPSNTRTHTIVLIAIVGFVTLAVASPFVLTVASADEVKIDGNTTLRVIDYQFTTEEIPEDDSAKVRMTLQNAGASEVTGTLELVANPVGPADISFVPADVNYTIPAGARKSYVFEVEAANTSLDTDTPRDERAVELDLNVGGTTVPEWETLHVLPKGATVSEGSIEPTGERQTVTKSFTRFKDNGPSTRGSYSNAIPPVTQSDGEFIDSSQGRVFNFVAATANNEDAMRIESSVDGNINVGFYRQNIPTADNYTFQINYEFLTNNIDEAEIKIVSEDGTEIDRDTEYIISDRNTRETRYFQLSNEESEWIKQSGNLYVVIENMDLNTNQEKILVHFMQALSSDVPLQTESPNIQVTDTVIRDSEGNDVTSNPEFESGEIIRVEYQLTNTGNAVGDRQVSLYENGDLQDHKRVELNPQETDTVTFSFRRDDSGLYRYDDPSSSNDLHVYVEGEDNLPPIALITEPPEINDYFNGVLVDDPTDSSSQITLSAEGSFAPDDNIVEYKWELEWLDNVVTSTEPIVTVPGTDTKGQYNITLTVENSEGQTDIATETLRAGELSPEPSPLGDINVTASEPVSLNAGGSSHPDPYRCIVEYRWEKEDGTVIASNTGSMNADGTCNEPDSSANYTFTDAGLYNIKLVAEDDLGNTGSQFRQITVDAPSPAAIVTADEEEKLSGETFTFDASESFDSEGEISEYRWEMGDGTTYEQTDPTVSHSYESEGTYTAYVTVENEFGSTDSAGVSVIVLDEPFAVHISGDSSGETGDSFRVDNYATENRDNVDSWTWNMGDGTTYNGRDVISHTYNSSGQYTVKLTGTTDDFGGYTDSETFTIHVGAAPPEAVIKASYGDGDTVYVSDAITFDGTDSHDPDGDTLTYTWNMGQQDTEFGEGVVEDYEFPTLGEHVTTLTVENESGETDTAEHTLTVEARPPEASFTYSPQNPGPDEPITFDASTSFHREPKGEIQEYSWEFGDGNTATGETVNHSFGADNTTFEVTLTVVDQWGHTDSVTKEVHTDSYASCHEILESRETAPQSGTYTIDPDNDGQSFEVHCNMDLNGGGWTVITKDTARDFVNDIGGSATVNGNIQDWQTTRNQVYSVDGGGDSSFVYRIQTGFTFTEMRTQELTFGSASYKTDCCDTSEVRGDNVAQENWDDLNSGGVSGDIGVGVNDSVLDSWSRERDSEWNSSWQWNGSSEVNENRFHFEDETYLTEDNVVALGWGESGGQEEGFEWEKGALMVRQPVEDPTYFYNEGTNNANFSHDSSLDSGTGDVIIHSSYIEVQTEHQGSDRYIVSEEIDLSQYDTISLDYVLTVENGGSGYVEMEIAGLTARDEINESYLVNDSAVTIDVSDINGTATIKIRSHTGANDTTTTVEVEKVLGR